MPKIAAAEPRVRFVAVPFLPAQQPALGVSSLLSVLRQSGIDGDVRYLNLDYGERVGWDFYTNLVVNVPSSFLPGEIIFTRALWGDRADRLADYDRQVRDWFEQMKSASSVTPEGSEMLLADWWNQHAEDFAAAFDAAPQVVAEWADDILADRPRVLAFTSTFQQNVAALALAQEVRRRVSADEVAIVFGGANCEDQMGRAMADDFPFIDCVVSGEAEAIIVDLVRRLTAGKARGNGDGAPPRFVQGVTIRDLDALPLPDFDDYFAAIRQGTFEPQPLLAVESSRGCWWGAKSHCTFCGLNGGTIAFRSKSPLRFAAELEALSKKYGAKRFSVTDNILDMGYLRTLFPDLVKEARSYHLFYETKANIRKEQVELMAAAGVRSIQPGIENFSTDVLRLMGKGTTRLQNIQLLRWCLELGVATSWNLLYGFPGENPEDYQEMAELLPALFHLAPPSGCSKVRLDRFAAYWNAPERYGLRDVRPYWCYDFVYAGLPAEERRRLAYFFEYGYDDGRDPYAYASSTAIRVHEWRRASRGPGRARLELRRSAAGTSVYDTRPCRRDETYPLSAPELALLRSLDGQRKRSRLREALSAQGVEMTAAELESVVEDFLSRRFLVEENGVLLSLVVDPAAYVRVRERKVGLRVESLGLRWPDDFPDPEKQAVVRGAMLALESERLVPPTG